MVWAGGGTTSGRLISSEEETFTMGTDRLRGQPSRHTNSRCKGPEGGIALHIQGAEKSVQLELGELGCRGITWGRSVSPLEAVDPRGPCRPLTDV